MGSGILYECDASMGLLYAKTLGFVPAADVTDVTHFLQNVFQGVVAYGGPILLLQVILIIWLVGGQLNVDVRQQISELAGLIALALALAPEFRKLSKRMGRKDED